MEKSASMMPQNPIPATTKFCRVSFTCRATSRAIFPVSYFPRSRPTFQYLVPPRPSLSLSDKESHPQQHSTIRSGFTISHSPNRRHQTCTKSSPRANPDISTFSLHTPQIEIGDDELRNED
ncbi:hypothetical protein BLNAU_14678 [Blattamonas nauphoetae]|uniref:Uncharacterized protein n=1 Tax=Blattamonas nauphoetae TaxID=2049346 RepID=A0ABQ9XD60_9EUKA|nr:hypothetical protein BLNAU_14678 [Blattamonas nauphoetae]